VVSSYFQYRTMVKGHKPNDSEKLLLNSELLSITLNMVLCCNMGIV
jgi:hypothetical protein